MKRSAEAPFPLFSFMDIVTSVIGIVFLIIILLALELLTKREADAASAPVSATVDPEMTERFADLQAELQLHQSELTEAQAVAAAFGDFATTGDLADAEAQKEHLARELAELREQEKHLRDQTDAAKPDLQKIAELRERIEHLREQIRELEKQLAAKEKRDHADAEQAAADAAKKNLPRRLIMLPGKGVTKKIIVATVEAAGIRVVQAGENQTSRLFSGTFAGALRDFKQWCGEKLRPANDYGFLVYVAMNRADDSMQLVEYLKNAGFYGGGYEPLPKGATLGGGADE
ncbi:hypothetical protein FACS1894139_10320 [Planctomycetales bacterium]|nr:hypothetical protein FACS1894107_17320 [Planctomycetales bacterium]GHS97818.1 hypothetical protein FACS1894108_04840 [Planctomycetales bacterium]GHT05811.1 hypothetical protein FACS1894139_10320 [Planctomycetales bacterium]